jgi:hypothetical protein
MERGRATGKQLKSLAHMHSPHFENLLGDDDLQHLIQTRWTGERSLDIDGEHLGPEQG